MIGCHSLPPGDITAIRTLPDRPRATTVYLLRGWRDLWSEGIDQLAQEMREHHLHAQVFRAAQWTDLVKVLSDRDTESASPLPLVLIGFSYGADDAIQIAQELQKHHLSVDLLITIDPVTPPPVPSNVKLCYNYYQSNGFWDVFPWLRGIPLKSNDSGKLVNIDIRKDRTDLLERNTAHSNIAANPKLQDEIVRRVLDAFGDKLSARRPFDRADPRALLGARPADGAQGAAQDRPRRQLSSP